MIKRVEIIIYLNFRSDSKKYLQNIGLSVEYVNKKQGYAVTYADEKNLGRIINNLKKKLVCFISSDFSNTLKTTKIAFFCCLTILFFNKINLF